MTEISQPLMLASLRSVLFLILLQKGICVQIKVLSVRAKECLHVGGARYRSNILIFKGLDILGPDLGDFLNLLDANLLPAPCATQCLADLVHSLPAPTLDQGSQFLRENDAILIRVARQI